MKEVATIVGYAVIIVVCAVLVFTVAADIMFAVDFFSGKYKGCQ